MIDRASHGALPTFFVVGAARAGTTSLHYYLSLHPEIQMSAIKETHYFAGDPGDLPFPVRQVTDLGEYRRLFDPRVPVRGEASPSYAAFPRRTGVPARIREMVPEARFVYLVRDPIERTVSHYLHGVAVEGESRTFAQAVEDLSPLNLYLSASCYATQLEQYVACFPPERMLIVDNEALLHDRLATLQGIFTFLGVANDFDSPQFAERYRGSDARRRFPGWYRHLLDLGGRTVLARAPVRLRRRARAIFERAALPPLPPVEIDDALRQHLAGLLGPEAERFRRLTGREFPNWSL